MKRILLLSITLVFAFITSAVAQTQTVNPGVDPNEAKVSRPSEADVGAPGVCKECVARMKHSRMKDDTTFRPGGNGAADQKESNQPGTK